MNAELSYVSVLKDTYSYANRFSNEKNAEIFKKHIEEYIRKIERVLDVDIDKLTDDDFYKLLIDTYSITLDTKDYLNLLSEKNNKKYISIRKIPTNMTFIARPSEGKRSIFNCWPQLYQAGYDAAISSNMEYDYNKIYSKEEVEKLVSDKTIVLLAENHKPIDKNDIIFNAELFYPFLIGCYCNMDGNILSGFILENYHLFIKYLRNKFTKEKILMDIKYYIVDLNKDIEVITNLSNKEDETFLEISRLCNEWYESSNAKTEFLSLQRKLNSKRN